PHSDTSLETIHPQLLFARSAHHRALHSFPTRRSSDLKRPIPTMTKPARLAAAQCGIFAVKATNAISIRTGGRSNTRCAKTCRRSDRKSTRLNSSHSQISYAVSCLKKKTAEPGETLGVG